MTTTNRSFIKAYRHDAAQPRRPARRSPALRRPCARVSRPRTCGDRRSPQRAVRRDLRSDRWLGRETGHNQAIGHNSHGGKAAVVVVHRRGRHRAARHRAGRQRLLSAGTTVASFQWPAVCRALSQQCGAQLDRVADLLIAQAKAGRSLIGVIGLRPAAARRRPPCAWPRDWPAAVGASSWWTATSPAAAGHLARGGADRRLAGRAQARRAARRRGDPRHRRSSRSVGAWRRKLAADPLRLVAGLQAVVTAGVLRHAYDVVLSTPARFSIPRRNRSSCWNWCATWASTASWRSPARHRADPRELATLADQLGRSGCELLGTIENRIAKPQAA